MRRRGVRMLFVLDNEGHWWVDYRQRSPGRKTTAIHERQGAFIVRS